MLDFKAGDSTAFETLLNKNLNRVHAIIYRFMGKDSNAEDITQEVFLRVFRAAPNYTPTAKFSTWLYRIIANTCFNINRYRKNRPQVSLEGMTEDQTRPEIHDRDQDAPHKALEQADLERIIGDALKTLPENQRIAVILSKYEGKDYAEKTFGHEYFAILATDNVIVCKDG